MKIENNPQNIPAISPAATDAIGRTQAGTANASNAQAAGGNLSTEAPDQASLSSASTLVAQAISLPDVDMEKVTAIQDALAGGGYQVSSADVASRLIDSLAR